MMLRMIALSSTLCIAACAQQSPSYEIKPRDAAPLEMRPAGPPTRITPAEMAIPAPKRDVSAFLADPLVKVSQDQATECVLQALVSLIEANPEPAAVIARAAYAMCRSAWQRHIDMQVIVGPKYQIYLSRAEFAEMTDKAWMEATVTTILTMRARMRQRSAPTAPEQQQKQQSPRQHSI